MGNQREIPGYPGRHATSDGQIIGKFGRPLRPWRSGGHSGTQTRYLTVRLRKGGRSELVHKLVALAWHGQCPDGHEVDHANGDILDNRPENLEYVTHAENMRRWCRRSTASPASVTEDQVREIRSRYPGETQQVLADEFGLTQAAVSKIVTRRTWAWVA